RTGRQPATAPGTVIGSGPRIAMVASARATASGSAEAGARPLDPTARVSPSGRCTRAKRSPPTPHMCGYATAKTVAARSAASTALPPSSNAAAPARVASSCGVAIAQVGPEADRSMDARLPAERQTAISVREAHRAEQRRGGVVAGCVPVDLTELDPAYPAVLHERGERVGPPGGVGTERHERLRPPFEEGRRLT